MVGSTAQPQPDVTGLVEALEPRAYVLSEPHLSGYRVVLGFEKLIDAQNAHDAIARAGR
jgi:hypothetical protein